jgi:hypothetical protein
MDVPTAQEKSEQIFFAQPVPSNPLRMIAFFEQCQATDKSAGVLDKIAKDTRNCDELPESSR